VTQATPTAGDVSFPQSPQHAASGWRDIDSMERLFENSKRRIIEVAEGEK